jgi:hypothetical protein
MGKHEGMPYKSSKEHEGHYDVYFYEGGKEHKGWVDKSHVSKDWWRWEKPKPPAVKEEKGGK